MRFEFATAARIVFGPGTVEQLPAIALGLGRNALVVTGRNTTRVEPVVGALQNASVCCTTVAVAAEPTLDVVRDGARVAREAECDLVIGIGGGSAIDAAKAIAALTANDGDVLDYLEVIGKKLPLSRPSLPFVAIPTTAGTGSEVTRNAVLASPEHRAKVSLRSPHMLARVAIVDPDLLAGMPRSVLASSGLDALSQLIEPFVSAKANWLTDGLAREGLLRSARSLRRAFELRLDTAEREDLAAASLLGGLCLANAGLGAVHGFAAPIGGMFDAPHGAVCAALLPGVIDVNRRALLERASNSPALCRYDEVARIVTGRSDATAVDAVTWVRELCRALAIPGLSRYGVGPSNLAAIAEKAQAASSMQANPVVLNDNELREILAGAL